MGKIVKSFFFFFVVTGFTHGQLDGGKCGTFRYVQLLHQKQKTLTDIAAISRPLLQKNEITPSGHFRVHFDTTGINEPAMLNSSGARIPNSYRRYVDTLKFLLDSVWRAEIESFGFIPPPSDSGRGGGDEYDVYVVQYGNGVFGETVIEEYKAGPEKYNQQYTTFMKIENDFLGYRTKGDTALAATCAHEFHHAIQVGGSGVWEQEYFYFYELSAQSMEPTVFPHVKDYIFDLKTYYNNISTLSLFQKYTSSLNAGYERAIWGYYLMKKYGAGIMKRIWDEMKIQRPVGSSQTALNAYSTSLEREFAEFTTWNFYTGKFADSTKYFPDAKLFPALNLSGNITLTSTDHIFENSSPSFVANYYGVYSGNDSIYLAVVNTNYNDIYNETFLPYPYQLHVAPHNFDGSTQIYGNVFSKLTVTDQTNWKVNSFIRSGIIAKKSFALFPNPFNPNASSLLISTEGITSDNAVTLAIYSSSLELIYSRPVQYVTFSGTQYARWDGRDDDGRVVPSGVYFYVVSRGTESIKGKFAVIR
jgi:hypothetical protein